MRPDRGDALNKDRILASHLAAPGLILSVANINFLDVADIFQRHLECGKLVVYHKHWNDCSSNDIGRIIIEAFSGGLQFHRIIG